ncbi:tryptophan synthase subunit alpha [Amycolatopsis antarctica]|uniref:Tryptophan synthase alpha chain n=1 Tax=Amycolatopsis antarctica TaxID=1854586 RepID=A0A263D7Q8_9PSEU|nr:tryptophan synthase subunit alpha [Amycolatopsis antarctica]OZM73597.1 tryptophan synthase subunit alpha [Amycolatopsis antarctica]
MNVTSTGTGRVAAALATARAENRAALIGYLPAGFPSVPGSIAALRAMIDGGVDIVEIGLPYSDPVLDGPVIQRASEAALAAGTTTTDVFRVTEALAERGVPVLCMTYWNPIERYGVDRFAEEFAAAGGSGLVTPDLIPEEAGGSGWFAASDRHGLDRVFLVAPSSSTERIELTAAAGRGFVYAASLMGVTGTGGAVRAVAAALVDRVRAVSGVPVCVGLGVSGARQAADIAAAADGVIVGAGFVRRLLDAATPEAGVEAVRAFAAELADGVRARP